MRTGVANDNAIESRIGHDKVGAATHDDAWDITWLNHV
jgi:hypothetical protein